MTKFSQTISIALIVAVALCSASPARLERVKPSKSKMLARQEVAADIPAQTPYPPAGIRPEIPFNLPTDEKLLAPVNYYLPPLEDKPAKFYSPPAQVYGPPAQVYGPPAQTYGPPEVSVKDDVEEIAQEEPVQQPEEVQPEEQKPEESQSDEVQSEQSEDVSPSPQLELEQEEDNSSTEPESEQVEPAAVEDALPQRLVKTKPSVRKAAKLRSAKLQVVPAPRQAVATRPVFLGSLFAYNGQLYRL